VDWLLALDDARATDPLVAGAKASGLARTMAAGLPVLPGLVLTVEAGSESLRSGVIALERSSPAGAVLAVSRRDLEDATLLRIRSAAAALGSTVIVRSSSVQEADPRWAGAFATYSDVGPDDLAAAVRGCWASAFSRDALERCRVMGVHPADLRMAILVQPWIAFARGGTALVSGDGRVSVTAVEGSPAALAGGRADGVAVEVASSGAITADGDLSGPGIVTARAVADLARAVERATGEPSIEWGDGGGGVTLLQVRPDPRPSSPARLGRPRRALPAIAEQLAFVAARFPAPLGDELVLPWILGLGDAPWAPWIEFAEPRAALATLRLLVAELTEQAWGSPAPLAELEAAETIRAVRGPDPSEGLARLSRLQPVDPAGAASVLGAVAGIGRALVGRGVLADAELVWRLSPAELEGALTRADRVLPERRGPDRWEPFVFAVTSANGDVGRGRAAAPGTGAGRLRVLEGPPSEWRAGPREVLATGEALPQVAPLLWNAAGLVCGTGNPGAHLFEVARSLGVPAVVGVGMPARLPEALVAVDGWSGEASVLERRVVASVGVGA